MDAISNHSSSLIPEILSTSDIAMQVAQALKRLALGRLETDIAQAANRHSDDDQLPMDGPPITYQERRDALDAQIVAIREAFGPHILSRVDEILANQV